MEAWRVGDWMKWLWLWAARMLMCMPGCLSNLVMGYLEKTFLLAVARIRDSSLPFPPLSLPLTLCLQAEGGILYLDEGSGTAESCWQGFGDKSSASDLVLHRPPLCASLHLG